MAPTRSLLSPARLPLLLALIFFAVQIPLLPGVPVAGSSEAREMHVIQAILTRGEWILPDRSGFIPSKPLFFHWCAATVSLLSGLRGEIPVRSTSLLFGALTLMLTVALTIHLYSAGRRQSTEDRWRVGVLAGGILALTYGFLRLATDARVDMAFTFFVTASLAAFLLPFIREADTRGARAWPLEARDCHLVAFCASLATLTKGPLGLVLPGWLIFVALSYLGSPRRALAQMLRPRTAWIIYLLPVVLWYGFAALRGGEAFISRQLLFENVERFVGGERVNREPFWFYVPSFLISAFPWSLIFLVFLWNRRGELRNAAASAERLSRLPAIFVVAGVVIFSIASGKRHSYLAPLFPWMAIFVAVELLRWQRRGNETVRNTLRMALTWSDGLILAVLTALVIMLEFARASFGIFAGRIRVEIALDWLAGRAPIYQTVLLAALAILLLGRDRRYESLRRISAALAAFTVLTLSVIGVKGHLKQFATFAAQINRRVPQSELLVALRYRHEEFLDPVLYHLQRPTVIYEPTAATLPCGPAVIAIDRHARRYEEWAAANGASVVKEARLVPLSEGERAHDEQRAINVMRCRLRP